MSTARFRCLLVAKKSAANLVALICWEKKVIAILLSVSAYSVAEVVYAISNFCVPCHVHQDSQLAENYSPNLISFCAQR